MDPEVADDVDNLDDSEDKYEDAGELDMSGAHENLYLTRMPKMLWEGLSKMHENDEVRIGTLRIEGDRLNPAKVSLMLDHSADALKFVPREFNLRSTSKSSANTFVFSEKNLPGYRRRNAASKGIGLPSRQVSTDKAKDSKLRGKFFRGPGYRKAIPKRTSLIGHVQSEFNCLPVETDNYANVLEQRARIANKPKHELQLLEANANQGTLMTAGAMGSNGTFNNFIKGYSQLQKKQQQQKATRMPKNELRDLLFDCFRSYKFWFIRDLKKRTQQPEPWLRECLEDIAELVRQGPFANTWRLKPSSNLDSSILDGATDLAGFEMAEEGVAPDAVIDDGISDFPGDIDDEDEKNIKMEDVRQ